MARTKKSLAPAKSSTTSTAIATIDQELANEVALLKEQVGQASGNKIKVEPSGDFILPTGENLGDEINVVVIDFVTRNTFYSGPYIPNNPSPPDCYAIGKQLATMEPEQDSPNLQHDGPCATCALNQFGSGSNGKSKACKNSRVLAVVLVDPENPGAAAEPDAPLYTLELPPTAIRSFDAMVSNVSRALNGPPVKAVLTVRAKNVGTYALITFHDPLPNPDYAIHYGRRAEVQDMLYRKPDFASYEAKAPARGRGAPRVPARRTAPARR
jgi:hypothetical protein